MLGEPAYRAGVGQQDAGVEDVGADGRSGALTLRGHGTHPHSRHAHSRPALVHAVGPGKSRGPERRTSPRAPRWRRCVAVVNEHVRALLVRRASPLPDEPEITPATPLFRDDTPERGVNGSPTSRPTPTDRPPAGPPGPGTASRRRSRDRPRRRSGSTRGSPPCSPQTPRCRSGRAAGPARPPCAPAGRRRRRRGTRTGRPGRCPWSRYVEKNAASTSSREKPHVIWVRSLVPKEKNSAASAISSAVTAARGSSIMVPILCGTVDPALARSTSAATARITARTSASSRTVATSGIMISGRGSPPASIRSAAASRIGPRLHGEQARDHDAEADAAEPEHRVLLVQPPDRLEQLLVRARPCSSRSSSSATLHRQVGEVGEELVQRRVDQPDRHRQPVHRLEDPGEVVALQRQQRGQGGLLAGLVLGDDEVLDQLAAVAEEHVLGAAQADALGAEPAGPGGVLGGVGVRAHPQPAYGVGVRHEPATASTRSLVDVLALEVAHHQRVGDRHLAGEHLAGGAVDRDHVALVAASARRARASFLRSASRRAPPRRRRRCGPCRGPPRRRARSCRRGW